MRGKEQGTRSTEIMEKISIFNYEAYYLDHLEGNLSEEDTVLLLAFFEKHPELKLEDDFLPEFNQDTIKLDESFKTSLKQIDFAVDSITDENAEQFIIAETEGLLEPSKIRELDKVVAQNLILQNLRPQYAAARVTPDLGITFPDKDKLKKGRKIVLWPYISMAAAASVAAFFFLFNTPTPGVNIRNNGNVVAQNDSIKSTVDTTSQGQKSPAGPTNFNINASAYSSENATGPKDGSVNSSTETAPASQVRKERDFAVDRLRTQRVRSTELAYADQEIIERNFTVNSPVSPVNTQDHASLGFDDMKNPIKPVTNRLGDLINKEVDFRTAKADSKKPGGFLFKIGNFEISHKGH